MISVVIAAYNEEKTIGRCIDSLLAQTAPRDSFEIVVADDGSQDATARIAAERGVRVVTQPNGGAGAARNLGARQARGDLLFFIDADSTADPHWIEAMAAPFADPEVMGASGVKKTHQTGLWPRYVQVEYDFKYDRIAVHPTIDFVDSSTAGYRREVFLASGGFDQSLAEAEDVDLSFRLAGRGCRLVLAREAITYHTHPESPEHYLQRKSQYARWRAIVYARYPRKAASDQRTPWSQKVQPVLAYAMVPALVASAVWSGMLWVFVVLALLFCATAAPFVAYCRRASSRLALLAPIALWLSALAGGAGAAHGFLTGAPYILRQGSKTQ